MDNIVEPAVEDVLTGMRFIVVPAGIGGLGSVDVGFFTYSVLAGVCVTNLCIQGVHQ